MGVRFIDFGASVGVHLTSLEAGVDVRIISL